MFLCEKIISRPSHFRLRVLSQSWSSPHSTSQPSPPQAKPPPFQLKLFGSSVSRLAGLSGSQQHPEVPVCLCQAIQFCRCFQTDEFLFNGMQWKGGFSLPPPPERGGCFCLTMHNLYKAFHSTSLFLPKIQHFSIEIKFSSLTGLP